MLFVFNKEKKEREANSQSFMTTRFSCPPLQKKQNKDETEKLTPYIRGSVMNILIVQVSQKISLYTIIHQAPL